MTKLHKKSLSKLSEKVLTSRFSSEKLISDLPPVESETHHGLANSFRRLQMLYPTANMQLSNTDDGGAKVTLHVARA
ncbi:hypothetical protein [Lacticaseibacillus paracasei]|uniref:hypothetical protein n=1 Tax=Lacticaseibacillus paracasei TaxID=1597 RepID=UPI001F0038BB|nr:hypothetical protein [Lacticaseibacillus paracasei]